MMLGALYVTSEGKLRDLRSDGNIIGIKNNLFQLSGRRILTVQKISFNHIKELFPEMENKKLIKFYLSIKKEYRDDTEK